MGGIGAGGALAAGLLAFTGIGLIPVIIAALATTIASGFGLGLLNSQGKGGVPVERSLLKNTLCFLTFIRARSRSWRAYVELR